MFEDVVALFSGRNHEHEAFGHFFLPVKIFESGWAQGEIFGGVRLVDGFLEVGLRHSVEELKH